MDNLNNILEKILTLNVNANTNVDIQDIIIKYVLYTNIGRVLIAFLICVSIMIVVKMIIGATIKGMQASYLLKAGEEVEKRLSGFNHWKDLENLDKKVKEILEFMPRNKKRRKYNEEDEDY